MSVLPILHNYQTISLVGLTPNPDRASFRTPKYQPYQADRCLS